jgi:hypothetical protein
LNRGRCGLSDGADSCGGTYRERLLAVSDLRAPLRRTHISKPSAAREPQAAADRGEPSPSEQPLLDEDFEVVALDPDSLPLEPEEVPPPDVVVPDEAAPLPAAVPPVLDPGAPAEPPDCEAPLEVPVTAVPVDDVPLEAPDDTVPLLAVASSMEASSPAPASGTDITPPSTGVVAIPVAPQNTRTAPLVLVRLTPVRMAGAGLGVISIPSMVWPVGSASLLGLRYHFPVFVLI